MSRNGCTTSIPLLTSQFILKMWRAYCAGAHLKFSLIGFTLILKLIRRQFVMKLCMRSVIEYTQVVCVCVFVELQRKTSTAYQ